MAEVTSLRASKESLGDRLDRIEQHLGRIRRRLGKIEARLDQDAGSLSRLASLTQEFLEEVSRVSDNHGKVAELLDNYEELLKMNTEALSLVASRFGPRPDAEPPPQEPTILLRS